MSLTSDHNIWMGYGIYSIWIRFVSKNGFKVVMVNFPCQFELRDIKVTSKPLFLAVSLRVFPGEISIWTGRISKDHPHQLRWNHQSSGLGIEQNGGNRAHLLYFLCLSWNIHLLLPSDISTSGFWTLDSGWTTSQLSSFFSLRMADSGTSWPL